MDYVVSVPVADLWADPPGDAPRRETQLLLGERVEVLDERGGWLRVEAVEQPYFDGSQWRGYPGWVDSTQVIDALTVESGFERVTVSVPWAALRRGPDEHDPVVAEVSLGTSLWARQAAPMWWLVVVPGGGDAYLASSAIATGRGVVEVGSQLVGAPYLWGGRSAYRGSPGTSIDCSGLVSLVHRVYGIQVPRNAHDQFLRSRRLEPDQLRVGDLLFSSEVERPDWISHVMIYVDGDVILEATKATGSVRLCTLRERVGVAIEELEWGAKTDRYRVFFGSLWP